MPALGGISLGLEESVLQNEMGSSTNFESSLYWRQIFIFPNSSSPSQTDQVQAHENWSHQWPSNQVGKNGHKVFRLLDRAPWTKIQWQDLAEAGGAVGSAGDSERAIDNITMHLEDTAPKAAPARTAEL